MYVNILYSAEILVCIILAARVTRFKTFFFTFMCMFAALDVHGKLWEPEESIRSSDAGTYKMPDAEF